MSGNSYSKFKGMLLALFAANNIAFTATPDQTQVVQNSKKIDYYLWVGDFPSALSTVQEGLQRFPESKDLLEKKIQILCHMKEPIEALQTWKKYYSLLDNPDLQDYDGFLEQLSWTSIHQGFYKVQQRTRITALLAAAYTHQAEALPLLREAFRDSNYLLRAIAVQLAAAYGYVEVIDEILALSEKDPSPEVRLTCIEALGQLGLPKSLPILEKLLENPRLSVEEKITLCNAIAGSAHKLSTKMVSKLVASPHANLRQLACSLVLRWQQSEDVASLYPLLHDSSSEVRVFALSAIGSLCVRVDLPEEVKQRIRKLSLAGDPRIGITASWALSFFNAPKSALAFSQWLHHEQASVRILAAAAMATTGKTQLELMKREIKSHTDPYVKANLAIGLLGQREKIRLVSRELHKFFIEQTEAWNWYTAIHPIFTPLMPYDKAKIRNEKFSKTMVDQISRLNFLNRLAAIEDPRFQELIIQFLKNCQWEVTPLAAQELLEQGGEEAIEEVKKLLSYPNKKVRVQAGLVLSNWSEDEEARKVLQDEYKNVSRELQISILEALGHIKSKKSVPFLLEALDSPFPILRIVAASSLITCING